MTLIFRGTHTDPRFNDRVDPGRFTQNPWWPRGIPLIVCDMATDFALMQVIFHGTHTDPRFNDLVDPGRLTQNP